MTPTCRPEFWPWFYGTLFVLLLMTSAVIYPLLQPAGRPTDVVPATSKC